jgi:hypothetical protein
LPASPIAPKLTVDERPYECGWKKKILILFTLKLLGMCSNIGVGVMSYRFPVKNKANLYFDFDGK